MVVTEQDCTRSLGSKRTARMPGSRGQVLPRYTVVLLLVSRERFDHGHRLLIHESADQPVVEQVIKRNTGSELLQQAVLSDSTGGSGKSP